MDPITIGLIAAGVAASSGGFTAFWLRRRKQAELDAMRIAIKTTVPCGTDAPVSLLDIFWDLGSSDFALEMMGHRKLLLSNSKDLQALVHELPGQIAEANGYRGFIDQLLEAIQEFYREHKGAGDRRAIPALVAPAMKALPAVGESGGGGKLVVAHSSSHSRDWEAWRRGEVVGQLNAGQPAELDLDRALNAGVGSLLAGLFDGTAGHELKRWTAQREAKKLRDDLDTHLNALYGIYVSAVRSDPQTHANLHDAGQRWNAEGNRIAAVRQAQPYADKAWAVCADVLLEESAALAARLSMTAHANVNETLRRIDDHASRGNSAMAGYLVYVNRYALFVGRMQICQEAVVAIETASDQLRAKLASLQRRGLA